MKVRMTVEQQNIEGFIDAVTEKYHFNVGDKPEILKVYEQMAVCMGPYASYRINQRVTGLRIIDDSQTAIVAMTLGVGVDRLQERYIRADMLNEAYMLDCIANELLMNMYSEFNKSYARFHRRYVQRYVFIGDEIPLTVIPGLLDEIKGKRVRTEGTDRKSESEGDVSEKTEVSKDDTDKADSLNVKRDKNADDRLIESNEITANEYGVLIPSKSVVFYAILSENPEQACEGICTGCSNIHCENRISMGIQEGESAISDTVITDVERGLNVTKPNLNYGYQRIFGNQA